MFRPHWIVAGSITALALWPSHAETTLAASSTDAPARSAGAPFSPSSLAINGWVVAVGDARAGVQRVTVLTPNGPFEVYLATSASIQTHAAAQGRRSDLRPGLPVRVTGVVRPDATVDARSITVGDVPPARGGGFVQVRGRVAAAFQDPASASRLVVVSRASGDVVVDVGPQTAIVSGYAGSPAPPAALEIGATVVVAGHGQARERVKADAVRILATARQSKVLVQGVVRAKAIAGSGQRWIVGQSTVDVPAALASRMAPAAIGDTVSIDARRSPTGALVARSVIGVREP